MDRKVKIILLLAGIILFQMLFDQHVFAQSATVDEEEEKPYLLNSEGEEFSQNRGLFSRRSRRRLSSCTTTYLLVFPGTYGRIENLSAEDLARTGLQKQLKFPSLNFTVSAAAKLIIEGSDEKGKISGKVKAKTELRQMCLSVKIQGYDSRKRIVERVDERFGGEPVIALSIFPSDVQSGQSKKPGVVQRTADKVDAVSQHLGPLGGIARGVTAVFRTFFPGKDHISQIAYQSSSNSFGWIWRETENSPIEGIYKCMVLLRTHREVKYLMVKVDLITDWKRFGAWVKTYKYMIPVKETRF